MRRPRPLRLMTAAATLLALAIPLLAPAQSAAAAESLSVNLASVTGPATGVGEGFLYGVSQDGTQPPDQFLQPLGITAFRGGGHVSGGWIGDNYTDGSGTQADVSTVIAQARRLTQPPYHAQYQVIVSDIFGADAGQPSNTVYPCTNGNCSNWVTFLDDVVGALQASGLKFSYDIWNEPELSIFWGPGVNTTQYFQMWDTAFREIRRIAPGATIVGPSFAFTPQRNNGEWQTWLAHVKAAGTVPDMITNHDEGDVDDPVTVAQAINSDLSAAGLPRIPLSANEYQPADRQTTGVTAWYLARFAQSGYANAMRGNWVCCLTPNLTGVLTQANGAWQPNGNWWAMRAYADMTGSLVSTSGQVGSTAISAAEDSSAKRSVAVIGDSNGFTGAASVTYSGLASVPWLASNGSVNVTVDRIPDQYPLSAPQVVFDQNVSVASGSITVPLTFQAAHDAFAIYLTPATSSGGGFPSGNHRLVVGNDSLCLDVFGNTTAAGAAIDQWTCNGQPNQQFQFVPGSGGFGALQAQNSGDDITVTGSATAAGTPDITQEPASSSASSQWLPVQQSDGSFEFKNSASGLCLDVTGRGRHPRPAARPVDVQERRWHQPGLHPELRREEYVNMRWRAIFRKPVTIGALLALAAGYASAVTAVPVSAATASITVNGSQGGRTFDGIGAISGGGGNSRLLADYPAARQQQIEDYLFKPGYGADLQILKVEVGGDTNSTDGSESSIEHSRGAVNCNVGYEWQLMEAAKARNPSIKLYALAWGAPGWIGGGSFFSTDMISYLVSWLNCAKSDGLTINYLGGWNERGYNIGWYEQLRSALNAAGYSGVQLVADDTSWNVANDLVSNSAFSQAVQIVGSHYPCGYLSAETSCPSSSNAVATGKPLFASENGSQDYNNGAAAMARADNRDYLDGKMTATINWPIVASIYPAFPFATDGLILANQPSSGWYAVGKQAWVTAQTTQFTAPGWTYIDSASGYIGGSGSNGSYVTLKSPDGTDWSSIIETTQASAAQTVSYTITGGLSAGTVHVWTTNVSSADPSTWFVHSADITPTGGSFSLTLQPGFVYSLTTTTGQGKGTATSPAQGSLSLPYSDNFDSDIAGQQPPYLSQMQGAFEVEPCAGGRTGQCVQQQAPVQPIEWTGNASPFTIGGSPGWSNYTVSADALIQQPGAVQLIGRAGSSVGYIPPAANEYYLQLSNTGAWQVVRETSGGSTSTLASGTVSAPGTGTWQHLALTFNGAAITAAINGTNVTTVNDSTYASGYVGFGTSGYQTDQFDNLSVTPVGGSTGGSTGPITAGDDSAKCVDDNGQSTANGTKIQMWDCNGGANQSWNVESNGTLQVLGKCMDITGASTANGTPIELWDCNGGANQQWQAQNGQLVNPASGKCLDDPGSNTANGTQLDLWTCNGGTNQQWTIP